MGVGKIAILGQYKSGTTGLFYKIKNSLSAPIRTLFEPDEYLPEPEDARRWVLAKVILGLADGKEAVRYDSFLGFDKKLYLVRDPRDWLVSGTLFLIHRVPDGRGLDRILALLRQKERDPRSLSLLEIFDCILQANPGPSLAETIQWMTRQYEWLPRFEARLADYHRIKYEDFVDRRLAGMESYLGLSLSGNAEVSAEHDHVPRTERYGDWKNWLLERDVECFRPVFDGYIRRYGYSEDWSVADKPLVRPEFCSQYAERLVRKRRAAPRPS
ncbi:MAG: hypothetical protein ACREQ9_16460 [Candidatus Binatia bacterium]